MEIEDIIEYFKTQPLMYLATVDGNQPKVRPMALIYHKDTCWFVSIAGRKKIKEIETNDNVEFAINPQDREDLSTIRGAGRAILIDDQEIRQDLANAIPWFDEYWESAEDPRFFLYKIDLEQVSVQIPVKRDIYIFNIKTGKTEVRPE
ncbi:MAG: pyridoxamine 5'-phosphate oxidase family protein [Candidatus Heimdallarchaeota archaeon]|nr:pyridoxamine 5'-phosphate oxidase family protein [Candidatus Heimdallarchaeota archaeon]MCG3256310.1 pyridoxamine 5'-phosphate oxidase family protein [Candidatus Heimdallarchaeota archaeon]MCK4611378.1 pyridoxamine 5'-phosphate oxidase family protein [Candidatus Heimdallarchaeota archaeon]